MYKYQVHILVLSSLIFYSYENLELLLLLLFSASLNIAVSYIIVNGKTSYRKSAATLGVILNLSVLAFFKYSSLVARTFFNETGSIGQFLINIPLPIGISFFTFEGISLLIDVYKENYFDNKKFMPASFRQHARNTLFFISFFPHLVSGPILKAHEFLPQIKEKAFKDIQWEFCFKNLILGYFLKMVVADNLKDFTYLITYPYFESQSTFNLIVMLFGYSCQIFADFAGYSLIAIGLARLFGYVFNENFNFPYISSSFREFWKRWHISLSSFLMEYLYFPLGGNKKGKTRTYINLMITMILGGLWHGAAWSYAVWGAFHGGALALERLFNDNIKISPNKFLTFLKSIFVFLLVTLAWLLFKLPEFSQVIKYFTSMSYNTHLSNNYKLIAFTFVYAFPVIAYHFIYLMKDKPAYHFFKKTEYLYYATMLFLIVINSGSSGQFIYFQF
ncbi:MAG: MBOAT family O-acyltransferase [Chitinophagales bacterium]